MSLLTLAGLRILLIDSNCQGALERTSAVIRVSPRTCVILKSYLIMCEQNRKMSGDKVSKFLALSNEISGLWSVSRINNFPSNYIENLSQAHVRAKVYFCICA